MAQWPLKIQAETHEAYLEHTRSLLLPESDGVDNDDDPSADADTYTPASAVEREAGSVPKVQSNFLKRILSEVEAGTRPPISEWRNMTVHPDDPACVPMGELISNGEYKLDPWQLQPITFHDPTRWVEKCPCAYGGWDHAGHLKVTNEWRMRRAKDVFRDEFVATRRVKCGMCQVEHRRAKHALRAAQDADASSEDIEELRNSVKKTPYMFLLLNAKFQLLLAQRHAGVALRMPCFLTHRGAVTIRTLLMIVRSASTSQTPHDLESMFREFRATLKSYAVAQCYGHQVWAAHRIAETIEGCYDPNRARPALKHLALSVTPISDTLIRSILESWYDTGMSSWMHLWSEQMIDCKISQSDHHGKRFSRQSKDGLRMLVWRYTKMTEKGYIKIAVNTETCSYHDASLVAACDNDRAADAKHKREPELIAYCDNPSHDGAGLLENTYLEDGLPLFRFDGTVEIVDTADKLREACTYLSQYQTIGYDTENVAYIGRHSKDGENSNQAATCQLAGDDDVCFVVVLHLLDEPDVLPLKGLLEDENIKKVGISISGDDTKINKRFSSITVQGSVDLIKTVKKRVKHATDSKLKSHKLQDLTRLPTLQCCP
jgi:hypothetical protein